MKLKKMPTGITKSTQLINVLAKHGYRLFTVSDIKQLIIRENLDIADVSDVLATLKSQSWIYSIKRDLYALSIHLLAGQPIHEYEIATHIAKPSAVSHFSAFQIHQLTDQIPLIVFTSVPTGTSIPRMRKDELFTYRGVRYKYIQIKKEHFFGFQTHTIGAVKIPITDLERTLLDGLIKPQCCGGFMEVMHAFSQYTFDIEKLITYALRLDVALAKRLGWVLEKIDYSGKELIILEELPQTGYIRLVPSLKDTGPYNKRWQVRENL